MTEPLCSHKKNTPGCKWCDEEENITSEGKIDVKWPRKYETEETKHWKERYTGWNLAIDACKKAFEDAKGLEPDRNCDKDWFNETC